MKLALLTLAVLLAATNNTHAQNVSGEPPCATACITSAIAAAGCNPTDQGCPCGPSQTAIASFAAPCLISACPGSLLLVVESIGLQLCSQYSAGLTSIKTTTATTTSGTGSVSTGTVLGLSSTTSNKGTTGGVTPTTTATLAGGNSTITRTSSGSVATLGSAAPGGSTTSAGGKGTTSTSASASATGNSAAGMGVAGMGGLLAVFVGLMAGL